MDLFTLLLFFCWVYEFQVEEFEPQIDRIVDWYAHILSCS